jgi:hypothetical protein
MSSYYIFQAGFEVLGSSIALALASHRAGMTDRHYPAWLIGDFYTLGGKKCGACNLCFSPTFTHFSI